MVCDQNPNFWILKQTVILLCSNVFLCFCYARNVPIRVFFMLCVMSLVTMIIVGIDLGTHNIVSPLTFFCGV